jgi:tRNA G18 (ribose-2'-O)-methylase SpoU
MKNEESLGTMNEKETQCDKSLQEKNDSSFFTLHSSFRKLRTIEMNRLSVEEFKHAEKLPLIVVLDDVRSLYNVGSVFRTSDAFRVEAIYLCGITATPPSTEIHKTALGAEDSVEWKYFKTANEAVEELHRNHYFVYSIEQVEGSTKLNELNEECRMKNEESPRENDSSFFILHSSLKKFAVVFGNEVKGVHQSVIDMSDACLEIPQFGTKHSMNVSVTAGIVIWEFAKRFI